MVCFPRSSIIILVGNQKRKNRYLQTFWVVSAFFDDLVFFFFFFFYIWILGGGAGKILVEIHRLARIILGVGGWMSPGASQRSISISDPKVPWTWVVIVVYGLFYLLLNLQFSLKIKSYPLLVCEIKDEFYT